MKRELIEQNLVIRSDAPFKEALIAISDNHTGAVVVIDSDDTCIGVASDGDIRRALVQGMMLESPIRQAVNENSILVTEKDVDTIPSLFDEHKEFTLIPVVGVGNKLIDVYTKS